MRKQIRSLIAPSFLLILLAVAAAVLVGLAMSNRPAPPAPPTAGAVAVPVAIAPVRQGTISRTVPIAGVIHAQTETQLAARTAGRVLAAPVHEGDRVRRGELLVRLDDHEARSALESAAAGVRSAQAALAKAQGGAVIRGSEIDTGIATAEATLAAARTKLAQARGAARAAEDEAAAELRRAQAGLASAQANLATATRGARPAQLRQAQAALTQAAAAAQAARRGFEESQFLYDRGGLTRAQLDEARTADETARAQLDSARAALELVREGASPEERQAAAAGVRQAEAGVEAARAGARRARLASADAAAAEAQVRQAEAGLRAARAARAGRGIAREDTRAAAAALDQARVQWQQAREQVAAARLVSPADGVVTLRAAEPGQIAPPGQPLVSVASGPLFLEAPVSGTLVTAMRRGQPVELVTDAAPGRRFRAVLRDVPSVPGPDGRTYTVRASLREGARGEAARALTLTLTPTRGSSTSKSKSKSKSKSRSRSKSRRGSNLLPSPPRPHAFLAPGVRARGTVEVARAVDALLVPPAAVQNTPQGPVVWVARQGHAERRPVGIGIVTDEAVQIRSGVRQGEAVIVSGAEGLRPGEAVSLGSGGGT